MEKLKLGPPKTNPPSDREQDLNPGHPDFKSSALTTRPRCLNSLAFFLFYGVHYYNSRRNVRVLFSFKRLTCLYRRKILIWSLTFLKRNPIRNRGISVLNKKKKTWHQNNFEYTTVQKFALKILRKHVSKFKQL